MTRLQRIAWSALARICAVFCAATVALWAISYSFAQVRSNSYPGVRLMRLDEGDWYLYLKPARLEEWMYTPWDGKWYPSAQHPLWIPSLAFLILAAAIPVFRKVIPDKARFRDGGDDVHGGYDLRATPDQSSEFGARRDAPELGDLARTAVAQALDYAPPIQPPPVEWRWILAAVLLVTLLVAALCRSG